VAAGAEDYYLAEGEAPGRWLSDGGLELSGEVEAADLRALLSGSDPHTDDQLVRGPAGGRTRTPGFDLTFSAPNSVSLLYALGDPQLQGHAIEAHERAVGAALGYLEAQAAFLRPGRPGRSAFRRQGWWPPALGRHPPLHERRRPPWPRPCPRHGGAHARAGRVDRRRG
jgi:conjugative relaxase-like TrwC/TraI family protein